MEEDKKNVVLDELFKEMAKLKPRTEEEILKVFEKLGYKIIENSKQVLKLSLNDFEITIRKYAHKYCSNDWDYIEMHEHNLLHELFTIWGWI